MLDDIDFTVDSKPLPRNEAVEARLTKQWGPDPDPVSADHPTVFRFRYDHEPEMDGDFYRTHEQEGLGHGGYLTEHGNRHDRINLLGSTQFTASRAWELSRDEDGPLHGVARPIYKEDEDHDRADLNLDGQLLRTSSGKSVREKDIEYMSKEEKGKLRKVRK